MAGHPMASGRVVMAMREDSLLIDEVVPITGRQLTLPEGPIFHLQRAEVSQYEVGVFRAWAGYKNFGSDAATDGLVHFQHVLTFAGTEAAGRTGVHAHFAHAHIILPTSGRGVFSYDGVVTEATPGTVIVQHGGTVHDQFEYSYAAASDADNRATPLALDPPPAGAPQRSFGFLEVFVPLTFANVEIVPPAAVTPAIQRTAWDHPYHADGAGFSLQPADAADAVFHPLAGHDDLEVRDAGTWGPTGGLVATWIVRPAGSAAAAPAMDLAIPGETGGIEILFVAQGSVRVRREGGEEIVLETGDALTSSQGLVGAPYDGSPDLRLLKLFVAAKAQLLRERTPGEIEQLEGLGQRIISRSEVRPDHDARPINFLRRPFRP